jgi:hypothetical protein
MAAGVALMIPLSFMMGIPFPKAMEKIKKEIMVIGRFLRN